MKRQFVFFSCAVLLATPCYAQQPPTAATVPITITVDPLKSINTSIQADGKIYKFSLSVIKKDPKQTTGYILDSNSGFLWDPSNPWSLSRGFATHPGWQQPHVATGLIDSEMFPRFEIATASPTTALASLGYLLTAQGKRFTYNPNGGGAPGPAPIPERWGASSVGQSIDAVTPSQIVMVGGKPTIVVWKPLQVLGSTSAGHFVDPKDSAKDRDFPYRLTLKAIDETTGNILFLRGQEADGAYDVATQLKNTNLVQYPQPDITWDVNAGSGLIRGDVDWKGASAPLLLCSSGANAPFQSITDAGALVTSR